MSHIICVEIGSSRIKAALFDKGGHLIKRVARDSTSRLKYGDSKAEADPEEWLAVTVDCVRKVITEAGKTHISGIIVASEGPTLVAVDKQLKPVFPALLWSDYRAVLEAEILSKASGKKVYASWIPPKAMWLFRNRKEIFRKIAWIIQPLDYITAVFTGEIRFSVVSEIFNAVPFDLWKETGLPNDLIPKRILMGEIQGILRKEWSKRMALPEGIPVISGTGGVDAIQVILGTATLNEGIVCDKAGTSEGIEVISNKLIEDERFFVAPHPLIPGKYHVGGMMSTTGRALEWFRDCFYPRQTSWGFVLSEAAKAKPGASGLIFLPYLMGERTPVWDEKARGVFLGITQKHRRLDFARAVLEGVALGIDQIIDILRGYGIKPEEMRVAGWPAKSALWNQIKADITGLPVRVCKVPEVELLGLAIIAGHSLQYYPDVKKAALEMVRFKNTLHPREENVAIYNVHRKVYRALYKSLKPHFMGLCEKELQEFHSC